MRRPSSIAAPKGKAWSPDAGMGAVATTFMAGVELVRRGEAKPIGSLTQLGTIRLGKRTEGRTPFINEFVPLAKLDDIVFGGWDIFPDTAYEAAKNAGVLESGHLAKVKKFLGGIKPMKAAFDQTYVKQYRAGKTSRRPRTNTNSRCKLKKISRNFKKKAKADRVVLIWCGSTEIFLTQHEVHKTAEKSRALR